MRVLGGSRYIDGMARYLRIAAAVFLALLAVGLIGLWVRSYSSLDTVSGPIGDKRGLTFFSSLGVISVIALESDKRSSPSSWSSATTQVDSSRFRWSRLQEGWFGLSGKVANGHVTVGLPHWFLATCSFGIAVGFVLKRPWRFTTRGLLIATAVVAAILGLVVYAIKR